MNGDRDLVRSIRDFQWSSTSIGQDFSSWPPCIRSTINTMLSSPLPMWVGYLFPHLHFLFNDSFIAMFDKNHSALGKPLKVVWGELWEKIEGELENLSQGKTIHLQHFQIFTKSATNSFKREEYVNLSIIPIGDGSQVFGVFCMPMIVTEKVISERRFSIIKEINQFNTLNEKKQKGVTSKVFEFLSHNREDIPFAVIYILNTDKDKAILQNNYGVELNAQSLSPLLSFDINHYSNFLFTIISTFKTSKRLITSIEDENGFSFGVGGNKVTKAIFEPILIPSQKEPIAVLVMGVNPCCEMDDGYSLFFHVISSTLRNIILEDENKSFMDEEEICKYQLVSDMSLGFRIPISLVFSPVEEFLTSDLPPIQRARMELIHRNAVRLHKLLNSILELSRMEAGQMDPLFELTNLPSLTFELTSLFRPIIERANLSFLVFTPPLQPHEKTYVDREMWEKIILNLLSNAFKFTIVGSITLRIYTDDNHFNLEVADTGVGIPPKELPRLFERFKRVAGVEGRTLEGIGVGLLMVRELVKLHGGDVSVDSEVGKGSVFKVSIPLGCDHLPADHIVQDRKSYQFGQASRPYLVEASRWITEPYSLSPHLLSRHFNSSSPFVDSPKSAFSSPPRSGSLGARILIVDDNADIREYMQSVLELEDFCEEVIAIEDGELALQIALCESPDLILADVRLPKLSGLKLLESLRGNRLTQTIPFILLSSRDEEDDKVVGLKCGADDYILKPFTSKELVTRVDTHLKIAHARKIAFQRERELLLAANEAKSNLLDVVNSLPEGFIIENHNFEMMYCNETVLKHMRKTELEVLGRSEFDIFPDVVGTNFESDLRKVMAEKVPITTIFYYPAYDTWFEFRISPHPQGICLYSADISARKRLELEKDQAIEIANQHQQKRIREAEEYRQKQSDFIDRLCHALRNPLNGIYGGISLIASDLLFINQFSDRMSQRITDDDILHVRDNLKRVYDTVTSLSQCARQQKVIVDDVLCISKIDNRKVELNCTAFKLSDTILSVIKEFDTIVSTKKLLVSTKLFDDYIRADSHYLRQIIFNLFSNAVKFTPDGGSITLETSLESPSASDSFFKFSIADTGVGISKDEFPFIFDRFARKATEFEGSGLGLTVCKLLLELMGGRIDVKSDIGKGCEFILTVRCELVSDDEVKLIEESKSTLNTNLNQPIHPHHHHHHITSDNRINNDFMNDKNNILDDQKSAEDIDILIVDDNLVNRKIISRIMDQKGYHYVTAKNGKEAVDLFQKQKFDLIFMDVEMPVINGIEATKLIREKEKSSVCFSPIPIIGVSGNGNDKQVQCGLQAGMNAYLIKPYDKEQVFDMINQYIF